MPTKLQHYFVGLLLRRADLTVKNKVSVKNTLNVIDYFVGLI